MKYYGGYFELDSGSNNEYHKTTLAVNSGRNALKLILLNKKYSLVHIPHYICEELTDSFISTATKIQYYNINDRFEPIFDFNYLKKNECFFYINYFGLKDNYISSLINLCPNIIIDNSQAFFSKPELNIPTFYSCRKFFGVPDGAYIYNISCDLSIYPRAHTYNKFLHLIYRLEFGPEFGYKEFLNSEKTFTGEPIKRISKTSEILLSNINYDHVKEKRINNFETLHDYFHKINEIEIDFSSINVPFIYPLLIKSVNIKNSLIKNKIFVATYWPNIIKSHKNNTQEYNFAEYLHCLPIDQRYSTDDIHNISSIINKILFNN